jgi:hypothetical protein
MTGFGLPPAERCDLEPAERGDCVRLPNAPAAKEKSREETLSEFAFLLEASLESAPIAEASGHAATATSLPVAAQFRERARESVRTAVKAAKPFDNGPKRLSIRKSYTETDAAADNAEPARAVGAACVPRQESGVAEETTTGRSRRRKLKATALVLVSAGLIGAIIVLKGGALSLSRESRVIAEAGTGRGAESQRAIWTFSRQTYDQADVCKSRLLDAIATLTEGTNSLTSIPRGKSPMQSAINEAVEAPVALNEAGSLPMTGGAQSAEVEGDSYKLKSVDLGAQSVLAGAPQPATGAPVTASATKSPVGTEDGTSSTLSTPVAAPPPPSQSPDQSLDRATSPQPNGTPIVPAPSAANTPEGLPEGEASKPAIKRAPKPTQNAVGTALSTKPADKSSDRVEVAKRHFGPHHATTARHAPEDTPSQPMPALY